MCSFFPFCTENVPNRNLKTKKPSFLFSPLEYFKSDHWYMNHQLCIFKYIMDKYNQLTHAKVHNLHMSHVQYISMHHNIITELQLRH